MQTTLLDFAQRAAPGLIGLVRRPTVAPEVRYVPAIDHHDPLLRRVAELDHFLRELAEAGPCPEIDATITRLHRTIRALGAKLPCASYLDLEMAMYAHADAGVLHADVLHAFGMELLPPETAPKGSRTDMPRFGEDDADFFYPPSYV